MHQSTLLAALLLAAILLFLMVMRSDSFTVDVGSYGDYISSLMSHGEPYGRVYNRGSYEIVRENGSGMIDRLREWP